MQARRGALVDVLDGDGLLAAFDGQAVGLITWVVARRSDTAAAGRHEAEIRAVAVSPPARGSGVGRAMLEAAEATLARSGVTVAWLVTTNDNLAALALYQKAGWRLDALRIGALEEARRSIKPSLPEIGQHGIPLRDELELAKQLHGPSNLVQTSPPLG